MLMPALTKRRKWSRKIPLRQLVAHREVLKQIISGWNNSREGNSSFLLYHNLIIFLRFSPSLPQWGFSHTFIPTLSARWFFVTSKQQFSPAGQTPVLPCYLFASLIILCCNLVWIFEVVLISFSQAAVTQRILMKLTEIDSCSFTEAAGQRTGLWAGKFFSFGSKNTEIPLESLQFGGWVMLVAMPARTQGDKMWLDHRVLNKWWSRSIPVLTQVFLCLVSWYLPQLHYFLLHLLLGN